MEKKIDNNMKDSWNEALQEELREEFDFDLEEAESFFKENLEEFDFDLEDPYGDSFSGF